MFQLCTEGTRPGLLGARVKAVKHKEVVREDVTTATLPHQEGLTSNLFLGIFRRHCEGLIEECIFRPKECV